MLRRHLAACLVGTALLAAPAFAQSSFVTQQTESQWRASKLVGVNVYGTDNVKIGDINEVLLDMNGGAETAVIGVGGFLGIGEKNVGVPFKSIQWKNEPVTTAAATPSRTDVGTTGTMAAPPTPTPTGAPAPTGAAPAALPVVPTAADSAARGYPDHGVIAMTKAELQAAPDFKYATAPAPRVPAMNGVSSPMAPTPAPATRP